LSFEAKHNSADNEAMNLHLQAIARPAPV
jgi:hypothetical protein